MLAIYKKEMRAYFTGPLGYVFIAALLAIFGIFYSIQTLYAGYSEYGSVVLASVCSYLVFFIPILTMRVFSEELKNKTDQLLFTAPIKVWGIVLGKFLAAATVILIALALTFIQPLTTVFGFGGDVGWAKTMGGYLAIFLLCISFISVGIWISSKTENQLISIVLALAVILVFTLLSGIESALPNNAGFSLTALLIFAAILCVIFYFSVKDIRITAIVAGVLIAGILVTFFLKQSLFEGLFGKVLTWLNIMSRFSAIFSGLFNFSHILFFLGFTFFFLFLTVQGLEKKRWN